LFLSASFISLLSSFITFIPSSIFLLSAWNNYVSSLSFNFIFCVMSAWNLICHIKVRTYAEGEWGWGAEGSILASKVEDERRLKENALRTASWFELKYCGGDNIKKNKTD
jgi:hypothetical protein